MPRNTRDGSSAEGSRQPRIFQAAELALRLIRRAEKQHAPDYGDTVTSRVRTGLRALDDLRGLWWGLTVIHGGGDFSRSVSVTLAVRIALETARGGAPVLWLSLTGNEETPVLRLLTGMARVPVRDVFVTNSLGPPQWEALETARAELASLPLSIGDAHGLTLDEIRAACMDAVRGEGLALLLVDGLDAFDPPLLAWLERLGLDMEVPVVAVVTTPNGARDEAVKFTELRPSALVRTSAVLHVQRHPTARGRIPAVPIPLFVDVLRVAERDVHTVELQLDVACRWIDDVEAARGQGE